MVWVVLSETSASLRLVEWRVKRDVRDSCVGKLSKLQLLLILALETVAVDADALIRVALPDIFVFIGLSYLNVFVLYVT